MGHTASALQRCGSVMCLMLDPDAGCSQDLPELGWGPSTYRKRLSGGAPPTQAPLSALFFLPGISERPF